MKRTLIVLWIICFGSFILKAQEENIYTYTPDKENVVASAIEGKWLPDSIENGIQWVEFRKDTSIIKTIPAKYSKYLKGEPIYFAGFFQFKAEGKKREFPCILINYKGNPHIVFFQERDGMPMGDAESFNLFIARRKNSADDILFIGGDHNGEPFYSYKRAEQK